MLTIMIILMLKYSLPSCSGGVGGQWAPKRQCGWRSSGQSCIHPWHLCQNAECLGGLLPAAERIFRFGFFKMMTSLVLILLIHLSLFFSELKLSFLTVCASVFSTQFSLLCSPRRTISAAECKGLKCFVFSGCTQTQTAWQTFTD